MKSAIVSSAQLAAADRWDAPYHIMVQELAPTTAALEKTLEAPAAAQAAKGLLDALDAAAMKELHILASSSSKTPTRLQIETGIDKAPFVGLALAERAARNQVGRLDTQLAESAASRDRLASQVQSLYAGSAQVPEPSLPARKSPRP